MLKNTGFITKLIGGMSVIVIAVIVIWVSIAGNRAPNANAVHYLNDNASADNKVEALKTMTADLLAVETKNRSLQNQLQALQEQNKKSIDDLKSSMTIEMQTAVQTLQTQNQQLAQGLTQQWKQKNETTNENYPIHAGANSNGNFIWVSDLSKPNKKSAFSTAIISENSNQKNTAKPIYTIPVNATLTGAQGYRIKKRTKLT